MEFEFLLKIGRNLGIISLQSSKDGGRLLKRDAPATRKVTYVVIHTAGLILALFLEVYPRIENGMKQNDPRFLFAVGITVTKLCQVYSVIYMLWSKREGLQNVVEELGNAGSPQSRGPLLAKLLLVASIASRLMYFVFGGESTIYRVASTYLGCPQPESKGMNRSIIPFSAWIQALSFWRTECRHVHLVVIRGTTALQFLFFMYYTFLRGYASSMFIASALSTYRVAEQLRSQILTKGKWAESLKLNEYMYAKRRIGMVNHVYSPSLLLASLEYILFMSMVVPWAMVQFDVVSIVDIVVALQMSASFLVAAEANRVMSEVEDFLVSSNQRDAANTALKLSRSEGDSGLRGWWFFTISYDFVGRVGSAIFTYVLVVFQFSK